LARALITGAAGFIGQHLTRELGEHGHDVFCVDREHGDLRLPGVIQWHVKKVEPDVCVHLAAKVGRLFGEDDVTETILDNAAMTAEVAKACGAAGVRMVYASTSEVYGDNGASACDEVHGPFSLPHNAYGLSKGWGEEACELYAPTGLTILRLSMPYGEGLPWGRGRAAIVNMLWQAETRQPIPVHRGAERSWCYVADTVRAIRLIIERSSGGAFNVGRDDNPVPMLTVAKMACELTGAPTDLIEKVDPPANQTVVKRLATDRVRALGWQPEVPLEVGMRRVLAWVRERMEVERAAA
jgi:nucleoside-diphosphate-sugar epimerase